MVLKYFTDQNSHLYRRKNILKPIQIHKLKVQSHKMQKSVTFDRYAMAKTQLYSSE